MRDKAPLPSRSKPMKPGTFIHTLAVILSSITSSLRTRRRGNSASKRKRMTKKSDRASQDWFSLLQTASAFPPGRENPPRHGERYPWKKEIVTTVFLDRRAAEWK
jgi:hypothetical protein